MLRGGLGQQRAPGADQRRAFDLVVRRGRANAEHAVVFANVVEIRDAAQVHQLLGRGQPQLHQRDQAHAAGQQPWRRLRQQAERFVQTCGSGVFEILRESCAASCLDQIPDFFGRQRHVDVPHAQRAERIHHGIHHRRRTADGAGFADAFDAQRIHRRRRVGVAALDPGNDAGLGHGIVHQLAGDELAVVVVDGLLPERLAEALHHAAVHLAVDDAAD